MFDIGSEHAVAPYRRGDVRTFVDRDAVFRSGYRAERFAYKYVGCHLVRDCRNRNRAFAEI